MIDRKKTFKSLIDNLIFGSKKVNKIYKYIRSNRKNKVNQHKKN